MTAAGRTQDLVRTSIYQKLRSDVLSCELRPGQMLQERDLVARFQTSKSPIRDALLKLEEQGLVEVMPRKGYRVKRIDISDVHDMYGLRQMLERECVSLMIDVASDEVLKGLEAFRNAPPESGLATWIDYNRAFHAYIAANCGNARLTRIAREMIEQFDRLTYVSVTSSRGMALDNYVDEHGEIIDAICARNKRQAVARMREHIESSRKRVLECLETISVVDTGAVHR